MLVEFMISDTNLRTWWQSLWWPVFDSVRLPEKISTLPTSLRSPPATHPHRHLRFNGSHSSPPRRNVHTIHLIAHPTPKLMPVSALLPIRIENIIRIIAEILRRVVPEKGPEVAVRLGPFRLALRQAAESGRWFCIFRSRSLGSFWHVGVVDIGVCRFGDGDVEIDVEVQVQVEGFVVGGRLGCCALDVDSRAWDEHAKDGSFCFGEPDVIFGCVADWESDGGV